MGLTLYRYPCDGWGRVQRRLGPRSEANTARGTPITIVDFCGASRRHTAIASNALPVQARMGLSIDRGTWQLSALNSARRWFAGPGCTTTLFTLTTRLSAGVRGNKQRRRCRAVQAQAEGTGEGRVQRATPPRQDAVLQPSPRTCTPLRRCPSRAPFASTLRGLPSPR